MTQGKSTDDDYFDEVGRAVFRNLVKEAPTEVLSIFVSHESMGSLSFDPASDIQEAFKTLPDSEKERLRVYLKSACFGFGTALAASFLSGGYCYENLAELQNRIREFRDGIKIS